MTKRHFLFSALFTFAVLLLLFSRSSVSAGQYDKLYGWAWSENIGWVSMNCYNAEIGSACTSPYGVTYDFNTKSVTGSAWSEYGGWMCFGSTCTDWGSGNTPAAVPATAALKTSGLVDGWAQWKVLEDDGWMKLLGLSTPTVGPYPWCRNCDSAGNCSLCFTDGTNHGSQNICETCSSCTNVDVDHDTCNSCSACYQYGVGVDYSTNTLVGWGWNGDGANHGFGWLQFHPQQITPTTANPPYVLTQYGDIYGKEGVGSLQTGNPPGGRYSGSFMIQTDNKAIIHFNSCMRETGGASSECLNKGEGGTSGWLNETVTLDFPDRDNAYRNQFGIFDVDNLLAGNFGKRVNILSGAEVPAQLDGKVYYRNGDVTLANPLMFANGVAPASGAGTLVVRGNLTITANLDYVNINPAKLPQLASFGVIVLDDGTGTKGKITIDPAVTKLVGNFYAETQFNTGSGDQPLVVKGLVMSKELSLQRYFSDLNTRNPAESIIYDGRVLANPPPGFTQMSKYLPTWKTPSAP